LTFGVRPAIVVGIRDAAGGDAAMRCSCVLASTTFGGSFAPPVRRAVEEEIVTVSSQAQAARDDAHSNRSGSMPELRRSLGFLSNVAVAFSYICVSTAPTR
jgi:hypothetical protein